MPPILYSVFFICCLPLTIAWLSAYLRLKEFGTIDNNEPRQQQAKLSGAGGRAVAAQQNAWEAAIVYTASVFIAHAAGKDLHTLTLAGMLFALARILHAAFYVLNLATLRSLIYVFGFAICIYIALLAPILAA